LTARQRRLLTRAAPLGGIAAVAFAAGIVSATSPERAERRLVTNYVSAWSRGDYAHMYDLLDVSSHNLMSQAQFHDVYVAAASTATLSGIVPVRVGHRRGDLIAVAVRVRTKLFGTLRRTLEVPLLGSGSDAHVHFSAQLLFPGLQPGEQLTRQVAMPPRASLLARTGVPLAEGPTRSSAVPDVASQIAGTLGPIPAPGAAMFAALGYPADAKVGISGLERVFEQQLAGIPGGTLMGGSRVLARSTPEAGLPITTTIDPTIERAAVTAIAGRSAGIAAMDPRNGELLALAGFAFSALQPPGSTMKIVTATGALEAGIVKLGDTFTIRTSATLDGFRLHNANDEACGGTFLNAFAVSCNSVFAPLGAKLGARKLFDVAQRFGFNEPPAIPGAAESTMPPPSELPDDLAVGSAAIGQDKVQATALQMTEVGATIAMGGRRPVPTLVLHQPPRFIRVTSKHIAALVQRMMVAVVEFGTGTSAQISGVKVAGKTGTAELRNTTQPSSDPNAPPASSPLNTDAWFVGYAPVGAPRIVVGALFPEQGAGGTTAAPAVHDVIAAALHRAPQR
jgi:cell division protein FtsI/penicillin-binding protein 2